MWEKLLRFWEELEVLKVEIVALVSLERLLALMSVGMGVVEGLEALEVFGFEELSGLEMAPGLKGSLEFEESSGSKVSDDIEGSNEVEGSEEVLDGSEDSEDLGKDIFEDTSDRYLLMKVVYPTLTGSDLEHVDEDADINVDVDVHV